MKKYIRTKDGIILNPAPFNYGNNEFGTYMGESAKQANTIEDLCDFIAIVSEKQIYDVEANIKCYFKYEYEKVLTEAKQEYPDETWEMKLGILTDKGLIYVAKMNDKGELELL